MITWERAVMVKGRTENDRAQEANFGFLRLLVGPITAPCRRRRCFHEERSIYKKEMSGILKRGSPLS